MSKYKVGDYYGRNNTRIDWFQECDITEEGGVKL